MGQYTDEKRPPGQELPVAQIDRRGADADQNLVILGHRRRYFFKPNATKKLYADHARALQAGTGGLCSELAIPDVAAPEGLLARLRLYLGPNAIGRILFHIGGIDPTRFEQKRCAVDTRLGAARVLLALRAWQVERGELPAALELLVPRYLDAVPRDQFAGEPIHYDRAQRMLGVARADVDVVTSWPIPF